MTIRVCSRRSVIAAALLWAMAQAPARAFHIGLGNAVASQGAKVVNKAAVSSLPSCGGNFSLFSQAPVTDPNLIGLSPLGSQSSHVLPPDHMYFWYKNTTNPGQLLVAPSNGWVVQVTANSFTNGSSNYFIGFSPCQEVTLNFLGMPAISPAVAAAVAAAPAYATSCASFNNGGSEVGEGCVTNLQIPVQAGATLGIGVVNDFGPLEDSRIQLTGFANPARHNLGRGFCPLSYFQAGVLSSTYAVPGDNIGAPNYTSVPRSTAPVCGTIVQDIPGTAQGDWYVPASPESQDASYTYENDQIALVHDSVFWSSAVFSVGNQNALPPAFQGKEYFVPKMASDGTRIEYDFSLVNDNQIYCYDTFFWSNPESSPPQSSLAGNIVLLQLTDAAKDALQIEVQGQATACPTLPNGGTCNCTVASQERTWAFTSAAVIFLR